MQKKLVIFDCDGTLIDSQNAIFASMTAAFEMNGFAVPPRAEVLSIVGLSLIEAISVLMPGAEKMDVVRVSEGYRKGFTQLMHSPEHQEPMFPGARELITRLAARDDMLLGVATGKSRRGVDRFFAREGFEGLFSTIQTSDNAPSKPHPAMVKQAMAELGVAPGDTWMIGDTSFDIEMGRNAGVTAIGVSWGYHPVEALHAAGAHHVVDDFAQLGDRLGFLENYEDAGRI